MAKKNMKHLLLILLLVFTQSIMAKCPPVSEKINKLIKNHASKVVGGENCKFRKYYKDNKLELVAYTIIGPCYNSEFRPGSCGNNYFTSLIGIKNNEVIHPAPIGGKNLFNTSSISFEKNIIAIKGLSFERSDPSCCPSKKTSKLFKINELQFKQIQP